MAPPSLLTPERHQLIVEATRVGVWQAHAARRAGISDRTLGLWRERARRELDRVGDDITRVRKRELPYVQLHVDMEKAEADLVLQTIAQIRQGDEWKARAWFLERRFPAHAGQRRVLEHTGEGGGPVQTESTSEVTLGGTEEVVQAAHTLMRAAAAAG
jgi:hypothetical protein